MTVLLSDHLIFAEILVMFFKIAKEGEHGLWQYVIGVIMVVLAIMIGNIPIALAVMFNGTIDVADVSQLTNLGLDSNLLLVLMIIPFVCGLWGLIFVVKKLHHRKVLTVFTSRSSLDWSRVGLSFGLWFLANLIFEGVNYYLHPGEYSFRPPDFNFIILVLVALVFLSLQITFEEVFFRGYLLQGLGRLTNNRWLPLILTSVGFGLLHGQNPEVEQYGMSKMMFYYIGIGFVLGIITVMDDGLELALGIHAATNIYSATIVSYEGGAIQTEALFHTTADIADDSIATFLIFAAIFTLLLSVIYKWKDWGKLVGPIFTTTDDENDDNKLKTE